MPLYVLNVLRRLLSLGELRWVSTVRTRHEPIHGGSVATSLSLTVLTVDTHPSSVQVNGFAL